MKKEYIVENSVECAKCGEHIFSGHRHDFKYCKCGAIAADGGYATPFCCLWFAVDYDGNIYVYREYYGKRKSRRLC